MEKLDVIMDGFTDVEFGIESMLITLRILEELYDIVRNKELKAILNVTIRNMDSLRKGMRKNITDLDDYMIEQNK